MPRRFARTRTIVLLVALLVVAAWRFLPRPWHPTFTLATAHYKIASTATRAQTEEIGRVVESLYDAYSNRFGAVPSFSHAHPPLQLLLYKNRREMRAVNPGLGWAEAYHRKPHCRAYYSADELNSYHWMLHEAVHQLNTEVAHVDPVKWLEEGLAEYFSTSRIRRGTLALGHIDPNTYPVWWMDLIATTPDLRENLANGSVIPLRALLTNRGGPSMNRHFNLYYLHWWTLTHFVFEDPAHSGAATQLLIERGDLPAFERLIGPVEQVQAEWHAYVRHLKAVLASRDLDFARTGRVPPMTNAPRAPKP